MTAQLRTLIGALLIVFILGSSFGWYLKANYGSANTSTQLPGMFNNTPTDRELEKELVRMDIEEAGNRVGLSARQQAQYLDYLDEAATKYTIPMILVHSIVYVESSYDPSARHPQIIVKGKPTFAIGFGGIVWEYNMDALIKEGIATAKLELTEPRTNLFATAFIIRNDIADIFAKNPQLSEDRFFDELIKRYYGGYDEPYKIRMLAKIKDMASKQWIRRVVKTILLKYQTELPKLTAHSDSAQVGGTLSNAKVHTAKFHIAKLHKAPVLMHPLQAVSRIDTSHIHIMPTPIAGITQIVLTGFISPIIY